MSFVDADGRILFNIAGAAVGAITGGALNALYAGTHGGDAGKAFLVGAGVSLISGFALNPFVAGAAIGGATSYLNQALRIVPCDHVSAKDVLIGVGLGAIGGGVFGSIGRVFGATSSEFGGQIGQALGENAGAIWMQNLQDLAGFARGGQ